MTIIQVLNINNAIYGLGEDNKMYTWNFSEADWVPYFADVE